MATPSSNNNDGDGGGGNNDNNTCSWSSTTNWTIAGGCLDSSITFESSDSPIDSETVDAKGKPHLVLKPPSPDCGSCEIKLSFTQKHEVRQVYVRSTARVYEIYFAPSLQSSNEYLCTVRCGIAVRDDEVLHITHTEEAAGAHSKRSDGEQAKEKCSDDGNISPNSDDWIEVKVPDSPFQDNQQNSMPKKDFYEATAEITDADACISITIRLLSLQSKECLYVDEIYVFADPFESADSETQASQVANSNGSSLMAMLVPTLLQLSRTGNNQRRDKNDGDTSEKVEYLKVESGITDSTNIADEIQKEESTGAQQNVKLQEVNEATPEPAQFQILAEGSDTEKRDHFVAKTGMPYGRIEKAIEQLVSRVSRIEDICLRFEENMLKPISSMEARLQRVEEQVEKLAKNSQFSGLPSCTRISAPAFSCNGSNSSSIYNEGDDYRSCGTLELEKIQKKDAASDKLDNPTDDTYISVNDTRYLPSLVMTAPEFSCGDDEENNDAMELPEDCPQENKKQALSIDDALAAALAGFLSTSNVLPSIYTPGLIVQAPEFAIEEKGDDDKVASASAQNDETIVPTIFTGESTRTEGINDSVSTSSRTFSILVTAQVMADFDGDYLSEISGGVDGQDKMDEGGTTCSSLGYSAVGQTNDCQIAGTNILKDNSGNQSEDNSADLHEGAAASAEDVAEGTEKGTLQDVFKPSSAACVVDFELPILDVKFDCQETSNAKFTLEALLADMPEFEVETTSVQQRDDDSIGEQNNLILVEDGELNGPLTGQHLFVDSDSYDARDAPSSVEGEAPQYSDTSNEREMFVSLI